MLEGLFEERRRFRREAAELFVAVHGVLTPEQRAHLAEEIAEADGRWGWSRRLFGGHSPGRHRH